MVVTPGVDRLLSGGDELGKKWYQLLPEMCGI